VFFFIGIRSLKIIRRLLQNDRPCRSVFYIFLHPLTTTHFRLFSLQFSALNFGLPDFLLRFGFSKNTFFFLRLYHQIFLQTLWLANPSLITFIVVTIFGFQLYHVIHNYFGLSNHFSLVADHF